MSEETAIRCDVCGRREFKDERDLHPDLWVTLKAQTRSNSCDEIDLCNECSAPVLDLLTKAKKRRGEAR